MRTNELTVIVISILMIVCYFGNIYKITQCDFDFKEDMKCEIIHGVGLIGPVALVTFWVGVDK